jgi:phosphocarrier protein FPr
VPLLLGLGVDELSVSIPAIPAVKAQIRALSLADCQALAQRALALGTAAEVRALTPDPWAEAPAPEEAPSTVEGAGREQRGQ